MKKSIFLLGVAVAAMTSCSNDKLLDQAEPIQRAIGFDSFVNKGTKTVTETTDADLSKFYVFGYNPTETVFDNVLVTKSGTGSASGSTWSYAENFTKYWTKQNYSFAAYADGNSGGAIATSGDAATVSFAANELTIANYVVDDNKDLVADIETVDNSGLDNETVNFDFKHLLSMIQFQIYNTSADYRMRIVSATVESVEQQAAASPGLNITGVINKGTCILDEEDIVTWTPGSSTRENFVPFACADDASTDKPEYLFGKNSATTEDTYVKSRTTENYLVMPQNLANVKFEIRAQFLDDNDDVVAEKVLKGDLKGKSNLTSWQAGYSYVYTIQLPTAANKINFGVANVPGFIPYGQPIELNTSDSGIQNLN